MSQLEPKDPKALASLGLKKDSKANLYLIEIDNKMEIPNGGIKNESQY